jgi:hypothetical protein
MEGPVESILIRGKKQHMLNIEEFSHGRVGKVDVISVHSALSSFQNAANPTATKQDTYGT